jgi:hypothetical protein
MCVRQLGIEPTDVTFVAILNACNHGDLIDEDFKHFNLMRSMGIRHQPSTMVSWWTLFCHAGFLEEANNLP